MKQEISPIICLLLLLTIVFTSCIHPQYALNRQERAYRARAKRYEEINIYYDRFAVRNFKQNGTYTVRIDENLLAYAYLDTNFFKARAVQIADNVRRFMNFKEHHSWIKIIFNGNSYAEQPGNFGFLPQYSYTVRMPVSNIHQAVVVSSFNSYLRRR